MQHLYHITALGWLKKKFSEDGPSELHFEHNCDPTPAIFLAGKTVGAEYSLAGQK